MKTNSSRRTASARSRNFTETHPYIFEAGGTEHRVDYEPGESTTGLFGGNSNWRGPIWFPINYLLIEALERYHHFYGDDFKVECPTGSGKMHEPRGSRPRTRRAASTRLFLPDKSGRRPCHGDDARLRQRSALEGPRPVPRIFPRRHRPGLGASHQTGWTALAVRCVEDQARQRIHTRAPTAPNPQG